MRSYSYRCNADCSEDPYWDEHYNWGEYPESVPCPKCAGPSHRVIRFSRELQLDVDWQSRVGWDVGAGRYFSNRGERREWMKQNGKEEVGDCSAETLVKGARKKAEDARRERYDEAIKKHDWQAQGYNWG